MPKILDLSGRRFGCLTAISRAGSCASGATWLCQCDCGSPLRVYRANNLLTGHTTSCGCFARLCSKQRRLEHGRTDTKEWLAWRNMISRCYNPKNKGYPRYGGRGIRVCSEWRESFTAFFRDMGPCPAGRSLERKNNDLDYIKDNCRWATPQEQANNRRTNRIIKWQGKSATLAEWARNLGIRYSRLQSRLDDGWPLEMAFQTGRARCQRERDNEEAKRQGGGL